MITIETLQELPGIRHAFFTRRGGVSEGPYASLNCGPNSADDARNVAANRARAMERLGLPAEALVTLSQVHSARAITVTESCGREEADALVTDQTGVALGVLTADCAPVLLADAQTSVVGAAHAGWRGARSGVLEAAVEAMEKLGARRGRIVAAIGPCIGPESYEVGPEFHETLLEDSSGNAAFFRPSARAGHRIFNLPGYVASRLEGVGIKALSDVGCDTLPDEERFFSYRRATLEGVRDYGCQLSVIVLGP